MLDSHFLFYYSHWEERKKYGGQFCFFLFSWTYAFYLSIIFSSYVFSLLTCSYIKMITGELKSIIDTRLLLTTMFFYLKGRLTNLFFYFSFTTDTWTLKNSKSKCIESQFEYLYTIPPWFIHNRVHVFVFLTGKANENN